MICDYQIVSTGSKGNAVVLDNSILIDCGVPYKDIEPYVDDLKIVLLTHIHGDHFKPSTIRRLAQMRPGLRFAAGAWLVLPLLEAGVDVSRIDLMDFENRYRYDFGTVEPVYLAHDVPNCGYKIILPHSKIFYATDTRNLNGIEAVGYDIYFVEANYEDVEIQQRIAEKKVSGQFPYELRVLNNHLSKANANDWIFRNIRSNGVYVHMHGHVDKEQQT